MQEHVLENGKKAEHEDKEGMDPLAENPFNPMPNEIYVAIFSHLSPYHKTLAAQVCSKWSSFFADENLAPKNERCFLYTTIFDDIEDKSELIDKVRAVKHLGEYAFEKNQKCYARISDLRRDLSTNAKKDDAQRAIIKIACERKYFLSEDILQPVLNEPHTFSLLKFYLYEPNHGNMYEITTEGTLTVRISKDTRAFIEKINYIISQLEEMLQAEMKHLQNNTAGYARKSQKKHGLEILAEHIKCHYPEKDLFTIIKRLTPSYPALMEGGTSRIYAQLSALITEDDKLHGRPERQKTIAEHGKKVVNTVITTITGDKIRKEAPVTNEEKFRRKVLHKIETLIETLTKEEQTAFQSRKWVTSNLKHNKITALKELHCTVKFQYPRFTLSEIVEDVKKSCPSLTAGISSQIDATLNKLIQEDNTLHGGQPSLRERFTCGFKTLISTPRLSI